MTCYTVTFPGGATGILCGKLGPKCSQCGDVADVLCDYPIPDENRTCDRPLCSRCSPEVGVNENYCSEHLELGPGLVLFRRPERAEEMAVTAETGRQMLTRNPRLPKTPPAGLRWCVLRDHIKLTRWMNELDANRFAVELRMKYGDQVEVITWDRFVSAWRMRYPLKSRKLKKDQIPGPQDSHQPSDSA